MDLLQVRELLVPRQAAESAGIKINQTTLNSFNQTTLSYFNYTSYSNGTISNGSKCFLIFDDYQPVLFSNGTFVNGTSCYFPYYPLEQRGGLGIAVSVIFAVSLMFTLLNLAKHGRLYLPQEKRFRAIGRRWQWYWMLFVAACGIISGVSAVDVDRDYLQDIPIILQNFFFYLMTPGILACVWEGVRHWGSWQERQIYDHDPFSFPQNDKRGRKEFFMPLVFYAFAWLNFFMNIPRSWTGLEKQSTIQMTNSIAKPSATDVRFKVGGFLALLAWVMICYSLQHSIHYYKPRNRGPFYSALGFIRSTPLKFLFTIPLLAIVVAYNIASSFVWSINIGNQNSNTGWLYGLGYAPTILILIINEISGLLTPNEDRALIKQRIERGQAIDAELGIRHRKPAWWKGVAQYGLTTEQRLKALTTEIGGGRATSENIGQTMELGNMPSRRPEAENPFRDPDGSTLAESIPEGRPEPRREDSYADEENGLSRERTTSTTRSTANAPPQVVRSMLNI